MSARDVWILYLHEIRSALRERSVVIYSLLIPTVLYPALLWLVWTAAMFVAGQTSEERARIALVDVPAAHAALKSELQDAASPGATAQPAPPGAPAKKGIEIIEPAPGEPPPGDAALRAGDVDAILQWIAIPSADPQDPTPSFSVTILFDGSKRRSEEAANRLQTALRSYRDAWLNSEARRRGVPSSAWTEARFESHSVASGRDMGAFLLKLVIPMVLLVMISMGCFYPAIDATAGERERATWETLMTVGASRSSVVLAKYLYVATFGAAAGLLNLGAMIVSLRAIIASSIGDEASRSSFEVPVTAVPLTAVCAVLMALLIAGVMMILASLARTFKEGQAMISPFYIAIAVPSLLLQSPDAGLTPALALVPLVNVALTFREAITGVYRWPLIGLAAATQIAAIAACILVASYLTRFEATIAGPADGSLRKLLGAQIRRRLAGKKESDQ